MKAKALVHLGFSSSKRYKIVLNALRPEAENPASMRSKTYIVGDNKFIIIRVEAKDTVALRATLNAYLRWISAICKVCSILENF